MEKYSVPRFKDAEDFLYQVAKSIGKLKVGGIPNKEAAARFVLKDWNEGRISYFTMPPTTSSKVHLGASIVTDYSREFNIDEIAAAEQQTVLAGLQGGSSGFMAMVRHSAQLLCSTRMVSCLCVCGAGDGRCE